MICSIEMVKLTKPAKKQAKAENWPLQCPRPVVSRGDLLG